MENRRARPKIVQNVVDQGNAFFIKQANILNTSHKRHRRGVSSPDTEVLFLNKIERHNTLRMQQQQEREQHMGAPPHQNNADSTAERDQFNFTFYKDKSEQKPPPASQAFSESHINVTNLLNSAHSQKRENYTFSDSGHD